MARSPQSKLTDSAAAEAAYKRAAWLLTDPSKLKVLDFTEKSGAHSFGASALDRLPPEIAERSDAEMLDLRGTRVSDLSPIAGLTRLKVIRLDATQISDLSPLRGCLALRELACSGTPVQDVGPLAALAELKELHLDGTQVSDLSALANLKNLTSLWLGRSQVSDLRPLSALKLHYLALEGTAVSDLAPLSGQTELYRLDINNTKVTTLRPLIDLANLVLFAERNSKARSDFGGIEFDKCPIEDEPVAKFALLRNPERTRRAINFYRSEGGLDLLGDWQKDGDPVEPQAVPDVIQFPQEEELTSTSLQALSVAQTEEGTFDAAPPPHSPDFELISKRRTVLAEEVAELADECEHGNNIVVPHAAPLYRLAAALSDSEEDLVILRLRMSRVLAIRDAHAARLAREEHDRDAAPLPDGIASRIENIRGDIFSLINLDPRMLRIEQTRPAPGVASAAPFGTAKDLMQAASDTPGLLSDTMQQRLEEISQAAEPPPGSSAEASPEAQFVFSKTAEALISAMGREVVRTFEPLRDELSRIANAQEASNDLLTRKPSAPDKTIIKRIKERLVDAGIAVVGATVAGTYVAFLVGQASNILSLVALNPALTALGQLVQFLIRLAGGI